MIATCQGKTYWPVYIDRGLLLEQLEQHQAEIDEKRAEAEYGRKYAYVTCPDCGCDVAANWIKRHYDSRCMLGAV